MSVPLGSLEDFLGAPVTHEFPRSFMAPPSLALNDETPSESGAPSSRFANWRRNLAIRFATAGLKRQEAKQLLAAKRKAELGAPIQSEVDALKGELEALRNEMRMMRGEFNAKKGSNGSSGDDTSTIETATSEPSRFGLQDAAPDTIDTDSDEERGDMSVVSSISLTPRGRAQRHSNAAFDDHRFYGWSKRDLTIAASKPIPAVRSCPLSVIQRDSAYSNDEGGARRSCDLTPMGRVPSTASASNQSGFGDDQFAGWADSKPVPAVRSCPLSVIQRDSADSDDEGGARRSCDLTPRGRVPSTASAANQSGFGDDQFAGW